MRHKVRDYSTLNLARMGICPVRVVRGFAPIHEAVHSPVTKGGTGGAAAEWAGVPDHLQEPAFEDRGSMFALSSIRRPSRIAENAAARFLRERPQDLEKQP